MNTNTAPAQDFDAALVEYVRRLNEASKARHTIEGNALEPDTYAIDPNGKAWIRVTRDAMGLETHRSVHVFVERATGLIWKAAGWKGPARNKPRGSIFDLPPESTDRGCIYLLLGIGR